MQIFVINMPNAVGRLNFQQDQLSKLNLKYTIIDAITESDITTSIYEKHYFDWQRPLLRNEIACYYSHRSVWNKVINSNKPALILEDDALLSRHIPEILNSLIDINNIDFVNLENRNRKKFVSRLYTKLGRNSRLIKLHQDRTGAAGYVLWPSGAKKLIQLEENSGIGLADAHITACHELKAFQVEPSPLIQLDQCSSYGIDNTYPENISTSTVGSNNKNRAGIRFVIKRTKYQFKLGLRQLLLLLKSKRRYIKIRKNDFIT